MKLFIVLILQLLAFSAFASEKKSLSHCDFYQDDKMLNVEPVELGSFHIYFSFDKTRENGEIARENGSVTRAQIIYGVPFSENSRNLTLTITNLILTGGQKIITETKISDISKINDGLVSAESNGMKIICKLNPTMESL